MLGIELATAAFIPAAFVALLAGVLSFLSPCVLPIVPPYLAYMTGVGVNGLKTRERSAVLPALFFVLGLSTVFLVMGFAASAFGRAFLSYQDWLARGAGVMVIIMGLHFLHVIRIPLLDQEARMQTGAGQGGALGAYVLGLAFAFGWTPCIGPQLGMILSLAASGGELSRGTALLAIYALGLGIPFLLAAIFINRAIGLMNRIKPWLKVIERVMGALLIVVGIMLLTGALSAISFWLLETFPGLAMLG
ncbi:cytochrome c biogenesis protein CcdA [Paracoccus sp. 1_MG-2023]|uniref:cytochrome c biogenesis CcdA family protein n=1 Tax=unclassified Paracoccus (in: a-proteobacteria) TaxID=2688777 RepID=UPI001C07EFA8|nr:MULTISPECIES: cytochrome c biogenesis protein CcdA [unclassified Paracoccus (in: a-proteobacteria)]MBU2959019.1 cytochrome c biogenesis protein CcdA [Paracoccus sp. C2R09]MDO6668992.1 cytochrome c biogenesis protein CcdA [Paracoccus sp. 1_MG-2023]